MPTPGGEPPADRPTPGWAADPVYRLTSADVRSARFDPPPRRRDGFDAAQVRAFLARVADEIDRLTAERDTAEDTAARRRARPPEPGTGPAGQP